MPFNPSIEARSDEVLGANMDAYEAWFGAKVEEALADLRPDVTNCDVEREFAARRAETSQAI